MSKGLEGQSAQHIRYMRKVSACMCYMIGTSLLIATIRSITIWAVYIRKVKWGILSSAH